VTRQVRDGILRGLYRPGDDLPGERVLARTLGVSRLTLRAGLSRLEAEGLVRAVHGSGTRVLDFHESGGIELLAHLAAISTERGPEALALLGDLLELRRVLAIEAVGMVAARASADELLSLRAHIDAQHACIGSASQWIAADLAFARKLARATHNVALMLVANTLVRLLEREPGVDVAFMADPHGSIAVYRRVVALAEARDVARARRLTARLLERLDRGIIEGLAKLFTSKRDTP
jgi:GntR family transcriptional repressor for pyruvate dehydrogenase complex